jgi:transposase-like protein
LIKEEMKSYKREMSQVVESLQFNGYYHRQLESPFGRIEDIPVARFRQATDYEPRALGVFEQQKEQLGGIIADMHLQGISQRKVAKLVKKIYQSKASKNRVGAVHKQLAQVEEAQINSQPIEDEYETILLDGIWVRAKGFGWDSNKAVLLCALGVKADGSRKILGFQSARSESYEDWYRLLIRLKERGLTTASVRLAITDDTDGLTKALKQLMPKVPIQHCVVHKMRNVLGKTSHKHKAAMGQDLKEIYNQTNKKDMLTKAKDIVKKWYLKEPKAVASLKHHFEYTISYLDFPQEDHRKLRTTNILEREFREIRRRIKVFDSSFNDTKSLDRYGARIINYLNQNYPAV